MILSFMTKESIIKLNYFYRFIFIYLFAFESLLAALPLERGYYRLIGEVSLCANNSICLIIYKNSNSQRKIILNKSKWDSSLRSVMGLDVIIEGTLQNNLLKLQTSPKVRRLSESDLQFDDTTSIQLLSK